MSNAQCSRCQLGCSCGQNFPCILGSCYRSIVSKIRVWKSQKNNIFHGCLDPSTLRQIFLEIAWQNGPFGIGLSLLDFKQLLFDSGTIVQCRSFQLPVTYYILTIFPFLRRPVPSRGWDTAVRSKSSPSILNWWPVNSNYLSRHLNVFD